MEIFELDNFSALLPATLTIFHGAGNNADHFSAL
jgi:hypothetical protein